MRAMHGSRSRQRGPPTFEIRALDGFAQDPQCAAIAAQTLTGGCRVAGPQRIDFAYAHGGELELGGGAIHLHVEGTMRLRRAGSADGGVGRWGGLHSTPAECDWVA